MDDTFFAVMGIILLVAAIIIIGPLLLIWCINTLFLVGVAVSLKTWFAGLLFMALLGGSTAKK